MPTERESQILTEAKKKTLSTDTGRNDDYVQIMHRNFPNLLLLPSILYNT